MSALRVLSASTQSTRFGDSSIGAKRAVIKPTTDCNTTFRSPSAIRPTALTEFSLVVSGSSRSTS
eukprot:CAMPEP_0185838070 /NCGR_PEP_ID=MMETSP1353-20130828/12466_1 /TAXON_ID=1077150 /ORGANISM="Erythrolobus australicus, Strain CCMP3124" /LENGTH=64 /DNA_ID=CAMNT_0028537081 /DNA_START=10 /DNA_END=201 /DNA_ORIENTATION=+